MDDHDLFELLKEASVKEDVVTTAKRVADWVKANPGEVAGGGIGGLLAGVGGYLASRPSKKTGRSFDQGEPSPKKRPSGKEGLTEGLGRIYDNTKKDIANLAAKHPIAMGLASVPAGVGAGRYIASHLKEAAAKTEKKTKKPAKNSVEHARKWGRAGAALGAAPTVAKAALILAHPSGRKVLARHGLRHSDVLKQGLKEALVYGGAGYTAGRAAHRFVHGPAKESKMEKKSAAELFEMADQWGREKARAEHEQKERLYSVTEKIAVVGPPSERPQPFDPDSVRRGIESAVEKFKKHRKSKEKTSAGVIPMPDMGAAKEMGKKFLGKASDIIKAHPLKSVAGAAAVGRYVMPKKDEK